MNILPSVYFLLIFSLLSLGLSFRIEERARSLTPDRVQNAIIQLALAQHRHIADPGNPNFGTYAGDIATLVADGYLPVWEADPDFAFIDTAPPGLTIQYTAADNGEAGRIAARLGAVAQVTGNAVVIGFADPTDLALLDGFIEAAGGEMTGPLRFAPGIGDAIDLNQNRLVDAGRISARNPAGTGVVEADIIVSATATFNDININP